MVKLLNDVIETNREIGENDVVEVNNSTNAGNIMSETSSGRQPYIDLPKLLEVEFDFEIRMFTFLQGSDMKTTRFLPFQLIEADDEAKKEYLSGRLSLSLEQNKEYLDEIEIMNNTFNEAKEQNLTYENEN